MILSTLFSQVNSAYRGSDDDAPTVGTSDYTLWLNTTNRKIAEWARDGKNAWQSLYEARTVGTITVGTQTYDLDDDILIPAEKVIVTTTNDQDIDYVIAKPGERDRFTNAVYISGSDPQVLTFFDDIITGAAIVGGTITLPAYFLPADLTVATDTIPVDDPYWLVYAVASELAFNDLTYESKVPDLVAKGNNLYNIMASNNRRGTSGNARTAQTRVTRISNSR